MASSGLGRFGISLISLPINIATAMKDTLTSAELVKLTGSSKRLPNSITGLKPSNPALPVINSAPITVPYHSIIGDRGKGDCPNCTDGVVPYWSSHLDGAQSEVIVPGPHGACGLPQTIDELDRILRLHLRTIAPQEPPWLRRLLDWARNNLRMIGSCSIRLSHFPRACCCEACTIMLALSPQDPKRS